MGDPIASGDGSVDTTAALSLSAAVSGLWGSDEGLLTRKSIEGGGGGALPCREGPQSHDDGGANANFFRQPVAVPSTLDIGRSEVAAANRADAGACPATTAAASTSSAAFRVEPVFEQKKPHHAPAPAAASRSPPVDAARGAGPASEAASAASLQRLRSAEDQPREAGAAASDSIPLQPRRRVSFHGEDGRMAEGMASSDHPRAVSSTALPQMPDAGYPQAARDQLYREQLLALQERQLVARQLAEARPGTAEFIPSSRYQGSQPGYIFTTREGHTGYYLDVVEKPDPRLHRRSMPAGPPGAADPRLHMHSVPPDGAQGHPGGLADQRLPMRSGPPDEASHPPGHMSFAEAVGRLCAMGLPEEMAVMALQQANGDIAAVLRHLRQYASMAQASPAQAAAMDAGRRGEGAVPSTRSQEAMYASRSMPQFAPAEHSPYWDGDVEHLPLRQERAEPSMFASMMMDTRQATMAEPSLPCGSGPVQSPPVARAPDPSWLIDAPSEAMDMKRSVAYRAPQLEQASFSGACDMKAFAAAAEGPEEAAWRGGPPTFPDHLAAEGAPVYWQQSGMGAVPGGRAALLMQQAPVDLEEMHRSAELQARAGMDIPRGSLPPSQRKLQAPWPMPQRGVPSAGLGGPVPYPGGSSSFPAHMQGHAGLPFPGAVSMDDGRSSIPATAAAGLAGRLGQAIHALERGDGDAQEVLGDLRAIEASYNAALNAQLSRAGH
eukprot:TRINITY_DN27598_c0_g4_i1.p1 TRINITY_DN27598_c0_g4~~TRINITY_DN27598_c0_g4_i1.p1  ORF type:complete len:738 (+),score=132.95 TRINITY_DN27598_c0_g4_i1:53-2215(+)